MNFLCVFFYGRSHITGKQKIFYFWPGASSIIEQQHDKTNNMISVPSKDSDRVGHRDFFTVLSLWVQVTP